jgi:hypothetical protein
MKHFEGGTHGGRQASCAMLHELLVAALSVGAALTFALMALASLVSAAYRTNGPAGATHSVPIPPLSPGAAVSGGSSTFTVPRVTGRRGAQFATTKVTGQVAPPTDGR